MLKKYWREIVIVVLGILLFYKGCDNNPQKSTKTTVSLKDSTIVIPGATGKFETPSKQTELPSAHPDSVKVKGKTIYSTHPLDAAIKKQLEEAKDSIDVLNIAIKAGEIHENITDFSNKDLDLKVFTSVAGKLNRVNAEFKIHDKEAVVKIKTVETVKTVVKDPPTFGLLLGGGYRHALDATSKDNLEVNVGVRIKKITVLGGVNTEKQIGGTVLLEL